jgi:hypothetical protein
MEWPEWFEDWLEEWPEWLSPSNPVLIFSIIFAILAACFIIPAVGIWILHTLILLLAWIPGLVVCVGLLVYSLLHKDEAGVFQVRNTAPSCMQDEEYGEHGSVNVTLEGKVFD